MYIPLAPETYSTGIYGALPVVWAGQAAVDADAAYWSSVPVGSVYLRKVEAGHVQVATKVKADGTVSDWDIVGHIRESVVLADFTDGGSTSGTYTLPQTIPDKSFVERFIVWNNVTPTGAASTLTLIAGDGSDTDKYNTGTPSILTAADVIDMGVPSAPAVNAASTIVLTVAEASDFGDISVMAFDVSLRYRTQGT